MMHYHHIPLRVLYGIKDRGREEGKRGLTDRQTDGQCSPASAVMKVFKCPPLRSLRGAREEKGRGRRKAGEMRARIVEKM